MSESFICRRGGVGTPFAVIGVTYPEGSTCTCSDGTKTLTAKGTSGRAIFNIPYAGTWTVSCANGEDTASESVNITAKGQCESLVLLYQLYLFDNGATALWGKNKGGGIYSASDFDINANYKKDDACASMDSLMRFDIIYPKQANYTTSEAIDLTKYSTLKVHRKDAQKTSDSTSTLQFAVAVTTDLGDNTVYTNAAAKSGCLKTTGELTVSLDLTNITGEFFIFVWAGGTSGSYEVDKIWLEP